MPIYRIALEELNMDLHECPGALISCIDPRFLSADFKFARAVLWPGQVFEHIKLAGAGINFLKKPSRAVLLATIREVSVKLHHVKELAVINHWDCGAYGYSKSFASPEAEESRHIADLNKVRALLERAFPQLKVTVGYSKLTNTHLDYHLVEAPSTQAA